MNTETGQIYKGDVEIMEARQRGEPIVEVSERVAATMEAGHKAITRSERRQAARQAKQQQTLRAMQKANRPGDRRAC